MSYFDWLNGWAGNFVKILEGNMNKAFSHYDLEMANAAAKHSESMMQYDYCEHAPQGYWGSARAELVGEAIAFHNDASIGQALRNLAVLFLCSPGHSSQLWLYPVIGCGIAIRKLKDGWVKIFVTIRLRY